RGGAHARARSTQRRAGRHSRAVLRARRRPTARSYPRPMTAPAIPSLSASQMATLAALGEELTAAAGDVLFRVGDPTYPFIAIREGEVAILDAAGNDIAR